MNSKQIMARAAKAHLAKIWDAKPLPWHPSDDWHAEGGVIDLENFAGDILSALKEAGFVVVRREPTRKAMNAMYRAAFCEGDILPDWEKVYRAMIAAQEEDDENAG